MKKFKGLIFLTFFGNYLFLFSQVEIRDIEVVNPAESDFFLENFIKENNNQFTGIDTVVKIYNHDTIILVNEYLNGVKYKSVGYYNSGKKYRERNFPNFNNNLDGYDIEWYHTGQIKEICYFKDRKEILLALEWYENGNLKTLIDQYSSKTWFENGLLKSEAVHIDSTKFGILRKEYFPNGSLSLVAYHNMGKGSYIRYYENGQIKLKGCIYNLEIFSIDKWQEWHKNGQLKREYYFKEDEPNVKDGIWSWWDEKGNLIKQEIYKDGELIEQKFLIKERKEESPTSPNLLK